MGNLLVSIIGQLGGPIGVVGAFISNEVFGTNISGGIIGDFLGIGQKKAKAPTTEQAIKTSRPPRVSAYGRCRLYGFYTLFETASDGTAVDVYAVHEGALDGIEAYYLGDDLVTLTGTAVNTGTDGRYGDGAVNIYTTNGAVPGAGFPAITALLPSIWTAGHRGDGVVAMALTAKSVKAKNFQEVYPQSSVPVPSIVARWQKCPDPAAVDPLNEAAWTWTENPVRQLLHYKLVREGPKPSLPRADAGYAAALASLRSAWWARRIAPTLSLWIAAAAHCNGARALAAGGSEARYRSCLSHKHTDRHEQVVSGLLDTFDGWMSPRADGALAIYSGQYLTPTVSIGAAEILSYTFEDGAVDDDAAANEIVCSYVSSEHDFNTVETDPWRDEDDIIARGQVLSTAQEADVPSHAQARYLAKRRMARINAPKRGTVTTNIAGRSVRGQRYIDLTLAEAGVTFYDGPAEILALTRNIAGGVTFTWVAADPDIDTWNPALEEGNPANLGDRVPTVALDAPEITSATFFGTDNTASGTPGARIRIVVAALDRPDLTWFVRWRTVGAATWGGELEFGDVDPGTSVILETDFVPTDSTVEVQVAYQIGDGRVSPWSLAVEVTTEQITADTTAHTADATGITADRG
ncbi:MAG: hypothetical protein V4696_06265 [Pseudomonadota bacterium]